MGHAMSKLNVKRLIATRDDYVAVHATMMVFGESGHRHAQVAAICAFCSDSGIIGVMHDRDTLELVGVVMPAVLDDGLQVIWWRAHDRHDYQPSAPNA